MLRNAQPKKSCSKPTIKLSDVVQVNVCTINFNKIPQIPIAIFYLLFPVGYLVQRQQ